MEKSFKPNEPVVHPKHGLGCIGGMEEREIDGELARFLTVEFPRTTLTLSIPEAKLRQSGLRRLSSASRMRTALSRLPAPPEAPEGHWSRHATGYEEKLNSGRPELLAEIVRDLSQRGRSGAATRLYREALLRLAEELAIIEGITLDEAQAAIEARIPADPDGGRPSRQRARAAAPEESGAS